MQHLKDATCGQQYAFHNDDETKCIIALLSIPPADYPENINFKDYPLEKTRDSMTKIRKQAFSKVDINFLKDIMDALITFVKKHINDREIQDKFISTIKEVLQVKVYEKIDVVKQLMPTIDEIEQQICSKSYGILGIDDKLRILEFIKAMYTAIQSSTEKIIEIMGNKRLEELINHTPELEKLDSSIKLSELCFTSPLHLSCLNDVVFFGDEAKRVEEIFVRYNKYYADNTKEKSESTKIKVFNQMKKLIEKELIEFLPPLTVSQICKNIRYTDTISSSVMNYRSIWQERTSEELLDESLDEYLDQELPIIKTTMECTREQLNECIEEICADSPVPLPPSEKLVEEILAKSLFKLTFE